MKHSEPFEISHEMEKGEDEMIFYGFGAKNPKDRAKLNELTEDMYAFREIIPTESVNPDGKKSPASLFHLSCEAYRRERFFNSFQKANLEVKWTPANGQMFSDAMKMLLMTPEEVKTKLAGIAL